MERVRSTNGFYEKRARRPKGCCLSGSRLGCLLFVVVLAPVAPIWAQESQQPLQDRLTDSDQPCSPQEGRSTPPPETQIPALQRVDESTPMLKEVPRVTKERPMSFWMNHKLHNTQELLKAITLADNQKIVTYAEQLLILSKIEGFVRRKNLDYRQRLAEFQATLRVVKQQAERGDSSAVLAGFGKLTQSCVRCHQVLRDNVTPQVVTPERGVVR